MQEQMHWRQNYLEGSRISDSELMERAFISASEIDYGVFDRHYLMLGIKLKKRDFSGARKELHKLLLIDIPNKEELKEHRCICILLASLISRLEGIGSDLDFITAFSLSPESNYRFIWGFVNGGYLGIDSIFPEFSKIVANIGTSFTDKLDLGYDRLREEISNSVECKTPFSFIRLNDGEGCLLYAMDELGEFFSFERYMALQKLWKGWFGLELSSEHLRIIRTLKQDFYKAISRSSLIGFDYSVIRNWRTASGLESKVGCYYAGLKATFTRKSDCIVNSDALYALEEQDKFLTTILRSGIKVSFISCHPKLKECLENNGINVANNIVVPAEQQFNPIFGTQSMRGAHLDNIFQSTINLLRLIDPSEHHFWIVAAGPLGKIYTDELRQRGCCALDGGAIVDGLLGFTRRPRLKQFSLVEGSPSIIKANE